MKKIFAMVLCVALFVSMVSMGAFAAGRTINFTPDALGLAASSYSAGTGTVGGVAVEWIELGNYGNGVQMRVKNGNASTLWNTAALSGGITKIEFTYNEGKVGSLIDGNEMVINFGKTLKGADCAMSLVTVAGQTSYTITPDSTDYTFFCMQWNGPRSAYWDSIKVYYNGTGADPEPEPEPVPQEVNIKAAVDAASGLFTVKGVVTLVDGKNLYLQDSTGAICVRMIEDVADVALGDTVTATGSKTVYNGMPQLGNGTYEKSSGMTLTPKATTIDALTTADICSYVKLTGLTVTEVFDNDGAYSTPNITVTDGTNEIQIYKAIVDKVDDAWAIQVGDTINVTAAVGVFKEALQLRNTLASEIHKHAYTSKVTNPTLTANGYTTFTCAGCGDSYVKNYTFPDVPNTLWSYKAVEFSVAKNYFTGYKSGNFGPTDNITRQDFVVVLARIAKVDLSKYSGRTSFPDVKAGDYYEAAVKWASSTGVVSGYKNGNFGVGDKITREQLVTILYRYAQKMGYNTNVSSNASAKLYKFGDAGKVTSYAKTAVIWALDKGIISGMTASTVGPLNNASRGQVATILMNISNKAIMPW